MMVIELNKLLLTYGTKYNREMYWDGTDSNGNLVKEGTYTFEVRAIQEYEYLNSVDYGDKDSCLDVLMNSDNVQTQSFNVNVDVTAPEVDLALLMTKFLLLMQVIHLVPSFSCLL